MKITNPKKLKPKSLVVFDFDGTLTQTKSPTDKEMAGLVVKLLAVKKVAIIGGGKYELLRELFVDRLKAPAAVLGNLFLFPTTATTFYRYQGGWKNVYALHLTKQQIERIKTAFQKALDKAGYVHPKKVYGSVIEDRGTQVTLSFLGQDVVSILGKKKGVALKEAWTRENTPMKLKIAKIVAKYLPTLEVRAAGHTSIDVTKKGVDKAYGLKQIEKYLHVKIKDMLFVGDAIFPGGNDYAITKTKVDYIKVSGPEQTKEIIRGLLSQ